MAIVFWLALLALVYIYLGYPLLVTLLGRLRPRPVAQAAVTPAVIPAAKTRRVHVYFYINTYGK